MLAPKLTRPRLRGIENENGMQKAIPRDLIIQKAQHGTKII